MKIKCSKRLVSFVLALMMILPMISLPTFAAGASTTGTETFEGFSAGQTLKTSDGFAAALPINMVLEEGGNNFLRVPVACTNTASLREGVSNHGQWFYMNHAAFDTEAQTSIKLDLRMNGIKGTNPNVGVWIQQVGYTDASGNAKTQSWYRLFDVNLLTGDFTFNSVSGTKTGRPVLKAGVWNTVEVIFDPADGSFDIYVNESLYARCKSPVVGTKFTVAAKKVMLAVDSGNAASAYTTVSELDSTYSNCNYMDVDNFKIATMKKNRVGLEGFESFAVNETLERADGFSVVAPINKILSEGGNQFLRLPIACTDASNPKTTPTNRGNYFMLKHDAFSTTSKTSIKMNLRMNGVSGTTPNIGVWLQNVNYKDESGASKNASWYRLFDVNLLTGEFTFNQVSGTKTGAAGLKAGVWNAVEVVFDPADGSFDIYVNSVLYAECNAPVKGTSFAVPADVLMYAVCSSNDTSAYSAVSALNDTYSNCNYMDADFFEVTPADEIVAQMDFEGFTSGATMTSANGFSPAYAYNKILDADGNQFLRVPMVCSTKSTLTQSPTNHGRLMSFIHPKLPTNREISIKVDLRPIGVMGSNPNVGLWMPSVAYTNESGASATASWFRFFDVNLLTGEFTFNQVSGTKTGAKGLNVGEWNEVEVIFDPADGSFDIYVNSLLYAKCTAPVKGTNFTVPANGIQLAMCSSNASAAYMLASDVNETYSNANCLDVDNFVISFGAEELFEVENENLMYVLVGGQKIYSNVFYAPAGTQYTPVYFDASEYDGILATEDKSSVRISIPSGLRFATQIDTDLLNALFALKDAGEIRDVKFGTLIAPADYLTGEFTKAALNVAGKNYLEVFATKDKYYSFDNDDTTTHFVGSIVNLHEQNVKRDFSGRGFVTVTLYTGQEVTLYSDTAHNANVKTVAYTALNDPNKTWSQAQKTVLETFAAGNLPPLSEEVQMLRDLTDLDVLAIGDSLFGGHSLSKDQQWLGILAANSGWNLTNLGANGWTVAYNPSAYADPAQVRTSMYNKLMTDATYKFGGAGKYNTGDAANRTAADVDIIFLEGGWNDYGWGIPLGTADSRDGGTYMGAINLMIEKLLTDYPNAKVVLVTAWHTAGTRGDGATRMDFVANGMKQVLEANYANNDRVYLIDAGDPNVSGVKMSDAAWFAQYAIDNPHLNAEGMKIMADSMLPLIHEIVFDTAES